MTGVYPKEKMFPIEMRRIEIDCSMPEGNIFEIMAKAMRVICDYQYQIGVPIKQSGENVKQFWIQVNEQKTYGAALAEVDRWVLFTYKNRVSQQVAE